MPLDFCLLTPDGYPAETVPVSVPQHERFLAAAASLPPDSLLGRLGDFYADTSFKAGEVGALSSEFTAVLSSFAGQPELLRLVESLLSLCLLAQQRSCGIEVIAD